jgi:hypothetical protein
MKGGDPSEEEGHTGQARAAWEIGPSAGCEQEAWARQAWCIRQGFEDEIARGVADCGQDDGHP